MSIYSGFGLRDSEGKYNITVFDLVLSLSARVGATLKNRKPEHLKLESPEFKFLKHVSTLHRKLQLMEKNKHVKPFFS